MPDRNTHMMDGELIAVPAAADAVIGAGEIVAASATGYGVAGATAATLTYLGRAEEAVNNTGGANGAVKVLVRRKKAFKYANSSADPVTQASLGKPCYIVDASTVAATHGSNTRSAAGTVLGIDADGVWIE